MGMINKQQQDGSNSPIKVIFEEEKVQFIPFIEPALLKGNEVFKMGVYGLEKNSLTD